MENQRSSPLYSNVSDTDSNLATLSKKVGKVDNIYQKNVIGILAVVSQSKCNEIISSNTGERPGEAPSRENTVREAVGQAVATSGDRSKESGNKNKDNEETIMCENNELYGRT